MAKVGSFCHSDMLSLLPLPLLAAPVVAVPEEDPEKLCRLDGDTPAATQSTPIPPVVLGLGDAKDRFEVDRNSAEMGEETETPEVAAAMAEILDRDLANGDAPKADMVVVAGTDVDRPLPDADVVPSSAAPSAIMVNLGLEARRRNLSAPSCRVGPEVDPRRIVGREWIGVEGEDRD